MYFASFRQCVITCYLLPDTKEKFPSQYIALNEVGKQATRALSVDVQ